MGRTISRKRRHPNTILDRDVSYRQGTRDRFERHFHCVFRVVVEIEEEIEGLGVLCRRECSSSCDLYIRSVIIVITKSGLISRTLLTVSDVMLLSSS